MPNLKFKVEPINAVSLSVISPYLSENTLEFLKSSIQQEDFFGRYAVDVDGNEIVGMMLAFKSDNKVLSLSFYGSRITGEIARSLMLSLMPCAREKGFNYFSVEINGKMILSKFLSELTGEKRLIFSEFTMPICSQKIAFDFTQRLLHGKTELAFVSLKDFEKSISQAERRAYQERFDKEKTIPVVRLDESFLLPFLDFENQNLYSAMVKVNGFPAGWIVAEKNEKEIYVRRVFVEKPYRNGATFLWLVRFILDVASREKMPLRWIVYKTVNSEFLNMCNKNLLGFNIVNSDNNYLKIIPFNKLNN